MKKILLATNTFFLLTAAFFIPSIARADPFCINNVSTISGRPCVIVTPNPPPGDGGNSTVSSPATEVTPTETSAETPGNVSETQVQPTTAEVVSPSNAASTGAPGAASATGIVPITTPALTPATVSAISTRDITPFCNGQTCTYVPLEPIPGLPQTGQDFNGFLNGMFKLLFTIGGMVAVVSLVFGGVTYMVSEIVGKIEWAKKQMRAALWGLALLVVAWLILYTINPQLITFSFNPVEVRVTGTTNPVVTSGCMGIDCLSVAEQQAVQNVRENGTVGASTQAVVTTRTVAQNQVLACDNSGGKVLSGPLFIGGCTPHVLTLFSSCTPVTGGLPNSVCVPK